MREKRRQMQQRQGCTTRRQETSRGPWRCCPSSSRWRECSLLASRRAAPLLSLMPSLWYYYIIIFIFFILPILCFLILLCFSSLSLLVGCVVVVLSLFLLFFFFLCCGTKMNGRFQGPWEWCSCTHTRVLCGTLPSLNACVCLVWYAFFNNHF